MTRGDSFERGKGITGKHFLFEVVPFLTLALMSP